MPGVVDVRVEQVAGLRYLRITPDRARLARYGLTIEDVNKVTETMAVGRTVGRGAREGAPLRDRRADRASASRATWTSSAPLPLKSTCGQIVPLGDVAELALEHGPAQVSRDNQSRRLTVEFNVRGRDLVSAVEEARARRRPRR